MTLTRRPRLILILVSCAIVAGALTSSAPAFAAAGVINVTSSNVVSEFPEGMRFSIEVESENEIDEIAVKFRSGTQEREVYGYMEFDSAKVVDSELFWRTNTAGRYIPPGTIIYYYFEIRDVNDGLLVTDIAEFIYEDARFEWDEVSDGVIAVAYHGPVKSRAEKILEAIVDTIEFMSPILGAETKDPIRTTMYNNVREMLDALPPGSTTIRRELITEGQAFTNLGTLLVLGGRGDTGTAAHEVTHILVHRAGDSAARRVPSWLDEGLAEFGNLYQSISYDIALEFAMATDRLLPITSMPTLPGNPEDVIIFYGMAKSLIEYMVIVYGPTAMRDLLSSLKEGTSMDDAIMQIYGVSRIELENQWRGSFGAELYVPPDRDSARPTPVARRTLGLFSLTPQAGTEAVGDVSDTPTPTPTPEPEPTAIPTATPAPTQPPAVSKSQTEESAEPDETEPQSGGGCSAPIGPAADSPIRADLAIPLFVIGLVGLGLRRRRR